MNGLIDEVRIWSVVRSPADIAANFDRVIPRDAPGLVAYWRFNEAGQTVVDHSLNGHHGTLGGTDQPQADDPQRFIPPVPVPLR